MLNSKQKIHFVLAIPIINVVADSTQNYFSPGLASPGYIRALLLLLFIMLYFKDFLRKNSITYLIIFSLLYYLILSLFSSNFSYTLSIFLKFLIATLMFPIGYYYINSMHKLKTLLKIMIWVLGLYVISLIVSNIFNLGSSDYIDNTVYFGAGRVNITKGIIFILIIFPAILKFENQRTNRYIYLILFIIGLIFVFLGVKRSAILGLLIGYLIYLFFTPYKTKFIKSFVALLAFIYLLSPLYYETLEKRIIVRKDEGRFDINQAAKEEARIKELQTVSNAFREGNLSYKFFGAELFNGQAYFKTKRILHTDYATMLAGSGLIGFILFMIIYLMMITLNLKFLRKVDNQDIKNILSISLGLIFALMMVGVAGTVQEISLRGIVFLFCGASYSVSRQFLRSKII